MKIKDLRRMIFVWTKIRNRLRPQKDFVLNLEPAIRYNIRVTARNVAGSTIADYEASTLPQLNPVLIHV